MKKKRIFQRNDHIPVKLWSCGLMDKASVS
uniref:Uncharacterized protein n=1 Tax=Heterorhabditis bacteriophora TaxID=37862 RepID=A0A1I7WD37_HETBA